MDTIPRDKCIEDDLNTYSAMDHYLDDVIDFVDNAVMDPPYDKETRVDTNTANYDDAFGKMIGSQSWFSERGGHIGGERYQGIPRRLFPSWNGWDIIDALKKAASSENELKKMMEQNERLKHGVHHFYKQMYWDRFQGDTIPDQAIAEGLFDISLNLGVRKAVSLLQESLNLLGTTPGTHASILEDGLFGPTTLASLKAFLKVEESSYLLKLLYLLQGMHYLHYLRKGPEYATYVKQRFKAMYISGDRVKKSVPATPTGLRIE